MILPEELYSIFKEHPHVSTDSRNISAGSIFFALKGLNFNGNIFALTALQQGASYVVIDEPQPEMDERFLLVDDCLSALQQLANVHRKTFTIPFLAITGSNGKTTTKELLRAVLSVKFRTVATQGNLNNQIGVPLTILSLPHDTEFAVLEMGANHQKEIESYCIIAEPDYGLVTNVGKAHLEGFGGFEGVKKGKGELYSWIANHGKAVFLNGDNEHLESMAKLHGLKNVIRYGTSKKSDCTGELIRDEANIHLTWKSSQHSGDIRSQIYGEYNFENILAAVCVGNYFDVDPQSIDRAIAAYIPDNSRSQVIRKGSNTIILDAYNANPTSMEAALKNIDTLPGLNKVICLGDMAELGAESAHEHQRIVRLLKSGSYKEILLVGKNFGEFILDVPCLHFVDSEKAASWIKEHPFSEQTILVKGSRSMKMEKLLEAL